MFLQQLVNALAVGGVYSLVGVGYTLVYGVLGLINFAHGAIYTWGAFFSFTLVTYFHIPFGLAFLLSMLLTSILGVMVERTGYFPVRKSSTIIQIVSVFGISIILDNLAMIIWGTSSKALPALGISRMWNVGIVKISPIQLIIMGLALVIMVFLYILVFKTKVGTAMRATSLDADAAEIMGIDVSKIRLLAFVISCALASAAGSLIAEYYQSVVFNMGYGVVLKAFVIAILGGMGNIVGAMLGGIMMGLIESFSAAYISSSWKDALVYVVLIFVLFVKPNGLLGTYEQEKA